ncbi:MAG: hypothetical protein D6689_09915 [Deltaproteobacteria bacterium]|nr:MAG: hypothetical protein D6689_09915 [Deltaproteobacteria bacterium]
MNGFCATCTSTSTKSAASKMPRGGVPTPTGSPFWIRDSASGASAAGITNGDPRYSITRVGAQLGV